MVDRSIYEKKKVFKETWEMDDDELLDYRAKYLPFVVGTQPRLAAIDRELGKRGLPIQDGS